MIDAALDAGAYGAKINGSGGGGCMFAYAPESPEKVKAAIEAEEGEAFIINSDSGSCEEFYGGSKLNNGKLIILAGGISSRMKMPAVNITNVDQKAHCRCRSKI